MLGLVVFGCWRLVLVVHRSDHPLWVAGEAVATAVVVAPFLIVLAPKKRPRTWLGWLPFAIFAIAVGLAFRESSAPGWVQVPGDVAVVLFGVIATGIRTRQKFWRADWRPVQKPSRQ
jgi:hypothetical protein